MLFKSEKICLVCSFIRGKILKIDMGGSKNKSPAQKEKSQTASKETGKKGKKKGESEGHKAEISVILKEESAMKFIKGAKVITIHELARQTGVKVSTANAFLRKSVQQGTVKRVSGRSGHHIYQPVSA